MASKKFEKGSQEWDMFMSIWAICQKHYIPEIDSDEYHEHVLRDVNEFAEKYNTPWGKALGKAVIWAVQDFEMKARELSN